METTILHKILNRLTGTGKPLHLVKHNQRFTSDQLRTSSGFQKHEKLVEVIEFFLEQFFYFPVRLGKINYKGRLVLFLGKFLHDPTLADTTRPLDKERVLVCALVFPLQQFVVDFTFHAMDYIIYCPMPSMTTTHF